MRLVGFAEGLERLSLIAKETAELEKSYQTTADKSAPIKYKFR